MALLDFIKNRQQQSAEQTAQPKQETAREMYTRETAAQQATAKPLSQISPEQRARVDTIKADLQKATHSQGQNVEASPPAPQDATENPQPMRQNMMSQDKAAPDLSPTSAQSSARAQDVEGPSAPTSTPPKSQQQTIARPAPSWER